FVVVVLVVGEDHAQTREVPAAHLGKDILSGPGIVYIRSRDHHGDEKTQGIHENMPLAALDLLTAVRAPLLATQGRLDRLTVESGGAGRRCPPGLDAGQGTQGVEDLLPGTVPVPPLEVVVDRLPRRQVMGQRPPGTPFAGVVKQGVDDFAQIDFAGPPGPTASLDAGQQRLDQRPLLVRQVAGIRFAFHTVFYANSQLWNRV